MLHPFGRIVGNMEIPGAHQALQPLELPVILRQWCCLMSALKTQINQNKPRKITTLKKKNPYWHWLGWFEALTSEHKQATEEFIQKLCWKIWLFLPVWMVKSIQALSVRFDTSCLIPAPQDSHRPQPGTRGKCLGWCSWPSRAQSCAEKWTKTYKM